MQTVEVALPESEVFRLQALQVLYRFVSLTLTDPRLGSWQKLNDPLAQELVTQAAALLREDPDCLANPLGWGERPVDELDPAAVLSALPASADDLNAAYEAMFGLLVSGSCPAYETEYINSKLSYQRSHALADVAGFYRAFGWSPSTRHPERADHIALELEFMATLCGMQLRADTVTQATICRDSQARFLAEHLVWWAPAFARLLAHENPQGFYDATGRLLTALLPAHRAVVDVPPYSQPARPSIAERPEECDGCLVQPSDLG